MKPNDKAIEAAAVAVNKYYLSSTHKNYTQFEAMTVALTAAYAAQFQSIDYAGLVKWLRDKAESLSEIYPPEAEAADALEALLAERDDWKKTYYFTANKLDHTEEYAKKIGEENEALRTERDALLARLAPVDDKALVEIAAKEMQSAELAYMPAAAIAAIRPHIEAAEREKVLREIREDNQAIHKLANDWGMEIKIEEIRSGK